MIKTKFICKIWAKSVGLSVRSFSIWLLFLWAITFDKAEPSVEQENFVKSLGSGKLARYLYHRELVIEICEFNYEKGKITKIFWAISNALCINYCLCFPLIL